MLRSASQLVPAWVALCLIAGASWVLFFKTTARWAWMLCPLWWSGCALYDLGLRLVAERTAGHRAFVVGVLCTLFALIAGFRQARRQRGSRSEAGPRRPT